MKILNLYFSATGNTKKVAETIAQTCENEGHCVETHRIKNSMEAEIDILDYDMVFAGSGVYEWLPGKPVMALFSKWAKIYREKGMIKQPAQRRSGKKGIYYCTYGGTHTGANEGVPTVKYMAQLFDHLGFETFAEWLLVGAFYGKYSDFSKKGKLGDITGRPTEQELQQVSEMVKGVLKTEVV